MEGLGPAAVLVILALGAALGLVVWQNVNSHWEADVERRTQGYASALSDVLGAEFDRLDGLVRRRAQTWASSACILASVAFSRPGVSSTISRTRSAGRSNFSLWYLA